MNFAFLTKNGVATAPANPLHPEHFTPDPKRDFLMNAGDKLTVRLFDTASGLRVVINDHTTHTSGSMTASEANGFGNVVFDPSATKCTVNPYNFHPEFSTSTPADPQLHRGAHLQRRVLRRDRALRVLRQGRHRPEQHVPEAARRGHERRRHGRA